MKYSFRLPCKAKRQYLLTLQVSRYCPLALQSRIILHSVMHLVMTKVIFNKIQRTKFKKISECTRRAAPGFFKSTNIVIYLFRRPKIHAMDQISQITPNSWSA